MKKAIILVNAYTRNENELFQPKRLKEELAAFSVQAQIVRNMPFALDGAWDFCVFLDKDKYAARALEGRMRLFNRAGAIEICDDKMLTFLALEGKVPMPETIPAPLCYYPQERVSPALLRAAEERLGLPLVVKECYGSLGKGVHLANSREELCALAESLKLKPHLFQRYVEESAGRDLRVIVVGGRVIAAMTRTNERDFRSNIELGGRGEKCEIDAATAALCIRVAKLLGLDYCGIDLLFGRDGPLVCEVNSNAFFGGIERVTGVNVARAYAEHIVQEVYGTK